MKTEKSCGAIVYTKSHDGIKYVIICSNEGIYGFPKGHMEGSETEKETALREVFEEAGLSVALNDTFRTEENYTFNRNGHTIEKHVVYFLGEYSNGTPTAQKSELSSIHLMDFNTALSHLQFEQSRSILTKAHDFLVKNELHCID